MFRYFDGSNILSPHTWHRRFAMSRSVLHFVQCPDLKRGNYSPFRCLMIATNSRATASSIDAPSACNLWLIRAK
jgi:hypothetical protein